MKIGRNEPCPCGGGIKYKKCCARKQETGRQHAEMGTVMAEVKELLKGRSFDSLEEANAFISRHMQQRNQAPSIDFHGLSPKQMHRILYFPFDTPHLVTLPSVLDIVPQAPIMSFFNLLVDGIGDQGLKQTATGNLPRNFCRESAMAYIGEDEYRRWSRFGELRTEPEFGEMHVTRLVAELAGLIRKYKGKFILSRKCRNLLAGQGRSGIYPLMFRAFVREYNWAYQDNYGEIPFIQHSFLFSLYLLTRYGSEWRDNAFYEDCFLRAFPDLLPRVQPIGSYYSPEKVLRSSYSVRFLERFAQFFGLAETERLGNDRYSEEFKVRKLPLLDHVAQFHLSPN